MSDKNTNDLLQPWLDDPTVMEIMVDGYDRMYVEKRGKLVDVPSPFRDDLQLRVYLNRLAATNNKTLDEANPMVDLRLPEDARATAVIPPVSVQGPVLVIRKVMRRTMTIDDLLRYGSMNEEIASFLKLCMQKPLSILVAGGTGSGKTTLVNVLAGLVPDEERLITVEAIKELQIDKPRLVILEGQSATTQRNAVTSIDLLKQAMKMRPDRIIMGELRGAEARDYLYALNDGYDGSLTSIHATGVRDALSRLETIVALAEPTLPLLSLRHQIASGFDLVISLQRLRDGVRRIMAISEITGLVNDSIATKDIFVFQESGESSDGRITGEFRTTGLKPDFSRRLGSPLTF
jgi:pilus assembly protein CpaF